MGELLSITQHMYIFKTLEMKIPLKVFSTENSIEEQEKLMDGDETLKEAKLNVKALSGGYKDAMKYQMAKIKYALFNLERNGKL